MREIRMLRTTWRELETGLRDGLRHRRVAKAAGKRLLPVPTATAPAFDPTLGGWMVATPSGNPIGMYGTLYPFACSVARGTRQPTDTTS